MIPHTKTNRLFSAFGEWGRWFPLFVLICLAAKSNAVPAITRQPASQLTPLGGTVSLTVTTNTPAPVQWLKNGQPIPGATSATFQIRRAGLNDTGAYRALVGIDTEQAHSAPAAVLVTPAWLDPAAFIFNLNQPPPADPKQEIPDATRKVIMHLAGQPLPQLVDAPRPLGKAWDFGKTDACIVVKACPATRLLGDVNQTTGFSFTAWVCGKYPGRFHRFTTLMDAETSDRAFKFPIGDPSKMVPVVLDAPEQMVDGDWHFLAISVDFTASEKNITVYLDGKLRAVVSRKIDQSFVNNGDFCIGARGPGNGGCRMKIGQVSAYYKALSADEVGSLFQTGALSNYAPVVVAVAEKSRVALPDNQLLLLADAIDDGRPSSLKLNWSQASGPGHVTFSDPSAANTRASFAGKGDYVVRFSASNGASTTARDFSVQVVENQPPEAMASAQPTAVSTLPCEVELVGGALDDGLPEEPGRVSFQWRQVSGPGQAEIVSPDSVRTRVHLPESGLGEYVFELEANDGALSSGTEVKVSVVADLPPRPFAYCRRPILDLAEGASVIFQANCGAAEEPSPSKPRTLSYSWTQVAGPAKMTFDNAGSANPKVTVNAPGVYQARVTVSDGALSGASDLWLKAVPPSISRYISAPDSVRIFSPNPPPFTHPRIFFTEADRAGLADKAKNDPMVRTAVTQMRDGIAASIDNPSTFLGQIYERMKRGDETLDFWSVYPDGKAVTSLAGNPKDFYSILAAKCYLAWLDQSDPAELRELAKVVATFARRHAAAHVPHDGLRHDVFADLALCYDLTYNWMTEDERSTTRALLAYESSGQLTPFAQEQDSSLSTNWRDCHDFVILAALAIEGEPGYDAKTTEINREALKIFTSKWGIAPEGFNREGPGYFSLGMGAGAPAAYALSRRGENMLVTTNLYPCMLERFLLPLSRYPLHVGAWRCRGLGGRTRVRFAQCHVSGRSDGKFHFSLRPAGEEGGRQHSARPGHVRRESALRSTDA